jgi:hypothetical protein
MLMMVQSLRFVIYILYSFLQHTITYYSPVCVYAYYYCTAMCEVLYEKLIFTKLLVINVYRLVNGTVVST